MAKKFQDKKRFQKRKARREAALPFTRTNYYLIAGGIGLVILGFIAMAEGSVDGTLPLVVAPILLVIGYCVIIPVGILYRKKEVRPETPVELQGPQTSSS
jgi:hypothetical protein